MIEGASRCNVLLLTVDCFRRDVFERGRWLDPVPGGRAVFDTCIATGPGTRTAFPGLLTSTYPLESGGYARVGPDRTVLSEPLRSGGYETAGFHSNPNLGGHNGWGAGFDTYYDSVVGKRRLNRILKGVFPRRIADLVKGTYLTTAGRTELPYERARSINGRVSAWLRDRDAPWFCWAHYMDLHHPYLPPAEFRSVPEDEARRLWQQLNEDEDELSDRDVENLRGLYRGEATYLEGAIRELLTGLEEDGALEETLVVLTADHGEEFREHGSLTHKEKVYEELINVPLVLAGDVVVDSRFDGIVSSLDVPVTVLGAVGDGVSTPESYRGLDLSGGGTTRTGAFSEIAHTRSTGMSPDDLVVAYRTERWKYVHDRQRARNELYDLEEDPGETENLIDARRDLAADLRKRIDDHVEAHLDADFDTHSGPGADVEARLANLGYR